MIDYPSPTVANEKGSGPWAGTSRTEWTVIQRTGGLNFMDVFGVMCDRAVDVITTDATIKKTAGSFQFVHSWRLISRQSDTA